MSVLVENAGNRDQLQSELFAGQLEFRNSKKDDPSVKVLNSATTDSQTISRLLSSPEVPSGANPDFGGRSFTELMVEIQKALAQMSYDTKIVSRQQAVTFGRAKAQTMDDGADKIRDGAVAAIAGSMTGAGLLIMANFGGVGYMKHHVGKRKAEQQQMNKIQVEQKPNDASGRVSEPEAPGLGGNLAEPAPPVTDQAIPTGTSQGAAQGNVAGASGGASAPQNPNAAGNQAGANSRAQPGGFALNKNDSFGGDTPDGAFISPVMSVFTAVGGAASTIANSGGDFHDKNQQAGKLELDADGQLFDTYAGEQSQFYQDADKNVSRALGLIGSLVGQIYNTNSSIISNMPR